MPKFPCPQSPNPPLYLLIPCTLFLLLILILSPSPFPPTPGDNLRSCSGRYIYMHQIPPKFNAHILRNCSTLSPYATTYCPALANAGLGHNYRPAWYNTNQFTLGVIFHNRMKRYDCLTPNSSQASAVYVPFYLGLEVGRFLYHRNISSRDRAAIELLDWLRSRPEWKAMGGKDHFLIGGRISWDFLRSSDEPDGWGSKFLFLPQSKNLTLLAIEASPWHRNDFAIPYPSYFHPSSDGEVFAWQKRIGAFRRQWLFSFAGARRPGGNETSLRDLIIEECKNCDRCRLMECELGSRECVSAANVMELFQSSVFCPQPPGDSWTRRSTFDSMIAGCIPVFFHPGSAYTQYIWYLPRNYSRYSVFIPGEDVRSGKVKVEEVLSGFSEGEVRAMREEVIRLVPRLVYADPRSKLESVRDAFDVAVDAVIDKVRKERREMEQGNVTTFDESNSWKYYLEGNEDEHEWDRYLKH